MKLWLITRTDYGYDEYDAFVIRADSEHRVREIAAEKAADEGAATWLNAAVKEISEHGEEGIVLDSFNAG